LYETTFSDTLSSKLGLAVMGLNNWHRVGAWADAPQKFFSY